MNLLLRIAPLLAFVALAHAGPDREQAAREKFAAKKKALLIDAGTARAKLGTWCRDAGLVAQATATFLQAVEDAEGENPWANRIIALMRTLDDKFWKTVNRHPSKALLDTFEKKSRRLDEDRQEALFKLAKEAASSKLADEAKTLWTNLVRETDKPLQFDEKSRILLPAGAIPEDVSAQLKEAAISVNDQLYLRDAFLDLVPQVKEIREAAGERVRVRIQGTAQAPEDLLASLEALLPYLEEDVGGRPTKRMTVFVFQDAATWGSWLGAAKLPQFTAASGLADGATNTALVCAEGSDPETLRGMCLHEMTHLFMFGVTPVVMPSWYSEGFAETWGGPGTFTWADGKLVAGGPMSPGLVDPLKGDGYIALTDLFAGDALALLSKDKDGGRRFYSESWALLRYLRTAAVPEIQERFRLWETACRGAALGAQAGKPREQDASPASAEFHRRFDADLPAIEKGFREWLAAQ